MPELHETTDDPRQTAGPDAAESAPEAAAEPAPEAAEAPDTAASAAAEPDGAGPDGAAPDSAAEDGAAPAPQAPTPEEERIAGLEAEIAALRDRTLRALADADNDRKRAARDVAESRRFGATGLARDILSVADNLGRALQAVPELAREDDENLFNLRTGVDMTLKELLQVLERHGVRKVTPAAGERFDHNLHQAMFEVPSADLAPGTVARIVQDGYVLHERLLRPALVGVARTPPEAAAPDEAAESAADPADGPDRPGAANGEGGA